MSVHSVESIVEWSVLFLDKAPNTGMLDKRSLYAALYRYQSEYDTGYTHFRVMDRLIAARFVYALHVHDHPDYPLFRDALNAIKCDSVLVDPRLDYDEKTNPSAGGYICDPVAEWGEKDAQPGLPQGRMLYVDAGSQLWRRMVEAGKLTGADALPPKPMSTAEAVAEIVTIAAQEGDQELIRAWLAALYWDVDRLTFAEIDTARMEKRRPKGRDLALLKADPHIRRVRTYAKAMDALSFDMEYGDQGIFEIATLDDPDVPENAAWWFDLDQDTDSTKALPHAPTISVSLVLGFLDRHRSALPQVAALIVCVVFGALLLRQRLERLRRVRRWRR